MAKLDITGGYDGALDYPLAQAPENPEMRDSVSMWISDDQGRFGLPRFCIEAVAGIWDNRGVEANIGFPDGRLLIGANGFAPNHVAKGEVRQEVLDAGPLVFRVHEPLRHWSMTFDGAAYETTVQRQMAGEHGGSARTVRIGVDAIMAVPPWSPGEQAVKAGDNSTALAVGAVGGHRHEQLFRCTGTVEIEGEEPIAFSGTGLRVRRTGVRNVGDFPGHCWQSALFPSGRAFGMVAFPPRSDGTLAYNEAYIFDEGKKHYAKVVEAPWMTRFVPNGGPVDIVLETEAGRRLKITGTTHVSAFMLVGAPMFGDWTFDGTGVKLPFHQGGARYEWDGETTYGMIERSLPADKMEA